MIRGDAATVRITGGDFSYSSDEEDGSSFSEWGVELIATGVGTTTREIQPTVTASETGEDTREGVSSACVMLAALRAQGSKMMDSLLQSLSLGSSVDPAKVRQLLPGLMQSAGQLDAVVGGTGESGALSLDSPMAKLKGCTSAQIEERIGLLMLLTGEGPVGPAVVSPPTMMSVEGDL